MRIFVTALIILVTFILQTTLPFIQVFGISPNALIVVLVSFSILKEESHGATIGFFAGLLQDLFFGSVIGLHAFVYMTVGFLSGKPFKEFNTENYLLPMLLVAIATFFYNFANYVFHFLFRARLDLLSYTWSLMLPSMLYNVILTFPIYIFIYAVNKRLEAYENPHRKVFGK